MQKSRFGAKLVELLKRVLTVETHNRVMTKSVPPTQPTVFFVDSSLTEWPQQVMRTANTNLVTLKHN